ncbi:uncharacterized protein LOC117338460 [Pecten maximus]|uniref:uncharacterized protein LOC117338460 n=1 Tax=Pecten maximus TaxID=6579 RepID=UPI001458477C|nr:uncharacterized protein LOC117338460 [Pecten maximus]
MTNQFPGHYKPSLSDHWNDLCIDQVKVSIYNGGQEKDYITFNAVGADKNSWFTADRIIDSSYTDIRNAPKELFSLMGDVTSGREFTMNSHSTGNCDTYGWMMVATQSGCFFEASAGNKPAFLYSPGQTSLHWGQATASGDVFAITAHGNCGASLQSTQQTGFTQMSRACIYKGKIYSQGDHWTDGCEYNCTCVDETTGRYNCVNLNPSMQNS